MKRSFLLSKWKIIAGIILYIVLGELLKDLLVFPIIEPYLASRFNADLAERFSEFTEYVLLAAIFIPVAIFFVINPVNISNQTLIELSNETDQKNKELQSEIVERIRIEGEKEALIKDLQAALSEVKRLSGLLPLCSHCKKVRDDKGYWNQIDAYIQEHSEVDISHSICPECVVKHYPGIKV
jgi:hypothetical protein